MLLKILSILALLQLIPLCIYILNVTFVVISFFTLLGDIVISMLGRWKWQSYWKTNSQTLQSCVADGKLDILYYGLPGLTSLLGMQLHGMYTLFTNIRELARLFAVNKMPFLWF